MAITDLDPKLLVEAHNRGDDDAFAVIVRAHHQGLFAHAMTRLREAGAAEDAVQETFVRAYRAMPRFQGEFQLRAWLHRILTNVCNDEGARRQRESRLADKVGALAEGTEDAADIGLVEDGGVDCEVVRDALAGLPPSYREALLLRYVKELSYSEVAAATGVTEGNARVRVLRGRAALKRALSASHALVVGLLPFLRTDGKNPVIDLSSLSASASASTAASAPVVAASSPALLRAADAAPHLLDRAAALPQLIGMVAAMAVPIAAPVVGDQIAGWVAPPPPVTAAPAPEEHIPPVQPSIPLADEAPAPTTTTAPAPTTTTPTTAPVAGAAVGAAAGSAVAGAPVPGATPTPPRAGATPTSTTAPPPAPPVAFRSSLGGTQITSVGDPRTELAGPVTWTFGGASVSGQLQGRLTFDRPAIVEQVEEVVEPEVVAEPEDSGVEDAEVQPGGEAPPAEGTDPAAAPPSEPTTTTTTAAEATTTTSTTAASTTSAASAGGVSAASAERRTFTGTLRLALDDGRRYELALTGGSIDAVGAGTALTAAFELRDACGTVVASGRLSGDAGIEQAPLPSSLRFELSGEGPADPAPCR